MGPYIGLNEKWPTAKVAGTGDYSINNRKVFPGVGTYCNGYIADGVFFNLYVVPGRSSSNPFHQTYFELERILKIVPEYHQQLKVQ